MINIKEFTNFSTTKLRSFLAILGILVGTASVVAMVSSGQLATEKALAQFKTLGTDLLSVTISQGDLRNSSSNIDKLTEKSFHTLMQNNPDILTLAPYSTIYLSVYGAGHEMHCSVVGANESLQKILKIKMAEGRFVSFLDGYKSFCVIGKKVFDQLKLYGMQDPLGQQIVIGKKIFTIIGVASPWSENSFFNEDVNSIVIIPIQSSFLLSRYTRISNVLIQMGPRANINHIETILTEYIKNLSPTSRLFFRSAKELIKSMQVQHSTLTLLLGLIGSISLIVGGIGVMNIMLVSVMERRREIGIRLAVGARRKDIQKLFLMESVILSVLGGSGGVLLGIWISSIVSHFAGWNFKVFLLPPIVGFMVSVAIGIFFGFYPAYKASHLQPIEALRLDH